ncbi:protein kinase domain-containing protein [Desulfolithobacter sp.]
MSYLQIGDTLDTFTIDRIIHGGAMARIYRAVDLLTDQTVILKIPRGDIFNHPVRFYHYQNEERIGRFLDHPGIVRFFYRKRSRPYIIQEYVEGRELRTLVGRGKTMATDTACSLIRQLARTLIYLHDQSICHLDLKPENVIITDQGTTKLLDFGLATREGMDDLLAVDFSVPHGTPYYIAPEQLLGRRHLPASDLYSLGVIFYEMVTGHLPFPRSRKTSITRWRLKVEPVPPRYYAPDIPPQLQQIILTCLERHVPARYQSSHELLQALEQYPTARVTEAGNRTDKPWQWLGFFLPSPSAPMQPEDTGPQTENNHYHILGAIANDDTADPVVEVVRHRTLLKHGLATLLVVIDDQDDTGLLQYSREIEGERFRRRLEDFIQRFRHYNLDPTIRLVRGEVIETILEIAEKIHADLIVLGPPRRPEAIFSQSVVDAVTSRSPTPVLISLPDDNNTVWQLADCTPQSLTRNQVLTLDLFFIDCWFDHVEWLGDMALALLRNTAPPPDTGAQQCCIGRWLNMMRPRTDWQEMADLLEPIHNEIHAIVEKMRFSAGKAEPGTLRLLYLHQALPCACRFRDQLQLVSRRIRKLSGHPELEQLATLSAASCPVYATTIPRGGPLLQLHTIRQYMEDQPEQGPSGTDEPAATGGSV